MAQNELNFEQVSTLLKATLAQVRGAADVGEITTANFASVGTTALKCGYDNLLNAISQVLSTTYFSIRPYRGKFGGLYVDSQKWGGYTRKVQVVDKDPENNVEYTLADNQSVDMYEIHKPKILQLNFYGGNTYSRDLPIFKDQLDVAFSSPAELGRFWAMLYQNLDDMVQQDKETEARLAVLNFIGGKLKGDTDNVIHLVTKYNEITGKTLDAATVRQPENWTDFCRWMLGYIRTLSEKMTNRTVKYHINVTGKPITRHTPLDRQKVYLLSDDANMIDTTVMSTTYNDDYLKVVDYEPVSFWQSIDSPATVKVTPSYLAPDGTITTATSAVTADVFGVIFDEEAIRASLINEWSGTTPLNARGGYSVRWDHYTVRWMNDFTENGLVLCLD